MATRSINQGPIRICAGADLTEGGFRKVQVTYDSQPATVLVFRHGGRSLAYLNRCVHMPRTLDCAADTIFDRSGHYLRCSMHGIVYDPMSGESLSEICRGQRLTDVELLEDGEGVWIVDRHVRAVDDMA